MKQAFRSETILPRVGCSCSMHSLSSVLGTPAAPSEAAALDRRHSRKPLEGSAHLNMWVEDRKGRGHRMTRRNAFAVALLATLLTATGAQAQSYPPGEDTQAPRAQDVQSPRGHNEDLQAPRGDNDDLQAPRGDNDDRQAPRGDRQAMQAMRGTHRDVQTPRG
jgi:hypothetical protein